MFCETNQLAFPCIFLCRLLGFTSLCAAESQDSSVCFLSPENLGRVSSIFCLFHLVDLYIHLSTSLHFSGGLGKIARNRLCSVPQV